MQTLNTQDITHLQFEHDDYIFDTYAVEDGGINVVIFDTIKNVACGLATIWIHGLKYDYNIHFDKYLNLHSLLETLCEYIIKEAQND